MVSLPQFSTAFLLAMVGMQLPALGAPTAEEVIDGVLARAAAFTSGRIEYRVRTGFADSGKILQESEKRLSYSPPNWAVTYPGREGRHMNYKGKFLTYVTAPQPDGSTRYTLEVGPPQDILRSPPAPPFFAGTIWYPTTIEYVRQNRLRAVLLGNRDVNGVVTVIVEFDVKPQDADRAFHGTNAISRQGGKLRLYVAPQLGYALPRIEHIGADGTLGEAFESRDFEEVYPGLFFPKRSRRESMIGKGVVGYYIDYTIHKLELVNEPIPEEDFTIQLPSQTVVQDSTDPNKRPRSFHLTEDTPTANLRELSDNIVPLQTGFWQSHGILLAVVIGANVGLVVAVLAFLIVRRRRGAA